MPVGDIGFFGKQPFSQRDDLLIPVLSIFPLAIFTYFQNQLNHRTAIVAFGACWMSLPTVWELSVGIGKEMRAGTGSGATWTNVSVYMLAILLLTASSFSAIL